MRRQWLAFDPGGATGWAHALDDDGIWYVTSGTQWNKEHHAWVLNTIKKYRVQPYPLTVITESFEFRQSSNQRRGLDLISREYIGVMKLICEDYNIPFLQQMPAHAIRFMSDDKLKLVGNLRHPLHDCRHENDALRHLFFKLISKDRESFWLDKLKSSISFAE